MDDLSRDVRLSSSTKLILGFLDGLRKVSLAKGLKYVWPRHVALAAKAKVSLSTCEKCLRKLRDAGKIYDIRQGQGKPNLIFFSAADKDDFLRESGKLTGLDPSTLTGLDPSTLTGLDPSTLTGLDPSAPLLVNELKAAAAEAAAAARCALEEFGVPTSDLDKHIPASLAEIAAHIRERISNPRKSEIGTGYVVKCVRDPKGYGFKLTPEGWKRPPERNLAAAKASSEGKRRTQKVISDKPVTMSAEDDSAKMKRLRAAIVTPTPGAVEKERKIDQAAVKVNADAAAWMELGEAVRHEIQTLVMNEQRRRPLFAADHADFTLLCYAEMRRRGLGPKGDKKE
jgi:hypothetical protein